MERVNFSALIMDDEADTINLITGYFMQLINAYGDNVKIYSTTNTIDAVSILHEHPLIDVLLIDYHFKAGMNGQEFVDMVTPKFKSLKNIVMISGQPADKVMPAILNQYEKSTIQFRFFQKSLDSRRIEDIYSYLRGCFMNQNDEIIKYVDFDLYIAADGNIIASSPEGEARSHISTQLPSNIRLSLDLIERRKTDSSLLKDIGISLYNWLFPNAIHTHFQQTEAGARNKAKIRLRMRIEHPEIASLPLEFIYRETYGHFIAANPNTVLSRHLNLPIPAERVRRREGPLHILAIIANPIDQVELNPNEWEEIIQKAIEKPLQDGQLTLDTVKRATRKEISNALRKQKPDIIQFVGHGVYKDSNGHVALVDDETNKTWAVNDELFANLFMGFDDHLKLIIMATCESAKSDNPQSFLGIAPQLVQRGTPAVVAMQYSVYIKTAKVFLDDFYTSVADRKPIDWAVQSARNAVSLQFGLDNREFATPVLYMRAKDGNVF